ncbi:MAG TPA: M15 family metallopeptidase [Solirubrobacterales bacterium]|nr:M15 family metallopeptidase [Solirubrobacterales bacterium]
MADWCQMAVGVAVLAAATASIAAAAGGGTTAACVERAFRAVGWQWGGRWDRVRDYQHFSANGR